MSSCRADLRRHGRRLVTLAVLALLGWPAGTGPMAKEATARGRKADITWVEPDGSRHTAHARDIRYAYYRRVYLSVPRDGQTFKDETRRHKAIPVDKRLIALSKVDRVDFTREQPEPGGRSILRITVTKANGKVLSSLGKNLPGIDHPLSPWIEFTVNGVLRRIPLHPVATPETLAGEPRLETIQIVL